MHEVNIGTISLSITCFSKYLHEESWEQEKEEGLHDYIIWILTVRDRPFILKQTPKSLWQFKHKMKTALINQLPFFDISIITNFQ